MSCESWSWVNARLPLPYNVWDVRGRSRLRDRPGAERVLDLADVAIVVLSQLSPDSNLSFRRDNRDRDDRARRHGQIFGPSLQ